MSRQFDLDRALRAHLATFADKRFVGRDALDELESHVRDEIEDLEASGLSREEAFHRAVTAFGAVDVLNEFGKLYSNRLFAQLTNLLSFYFDRRVVMRLVIGLGIGAIFVLGGLMLEGGNVSSIIQLTSALITVGGALGALIVAYPSRVLVSTALLVMTGRQAVRASYLDAAHACRSFGDFSLLSGFVGFLFGTIHVLQHLQTPEQIGPGVAVAVISVLYGLLIKLFIGNPLHASFLAKAYPSAEAVGRGAGGGLTAA